MDNELRDKLFDKFNKISNEEKIYFLCRLFGLMETYEDTKRTLSTDTFFTMVQERTKEVLD